MAIKRTKLTAEWGKASKAFAYALGYAGTHLSGWAKGWMSEASQQALSEIDASWEGETHWKRQSGKISVFGGDRFHPWYTGQLHDSVAGVVSDKNRIVSINYMPPAATKPQTYMGQTIIGHDWAIEGARRAQYVFLPGIQAKLVVGVPYAAKVDESQRHSGFVRKLSAQFASSVEDYFTIKAQGFKTRVFVADPKKK